MTLHWGLRTNSILGSLEIQGQVLWSQASGPHRNHTTRYITALYKLPSVRYIPALYKVKRTGLGIKWAAFKKCSLKTPGLFIMVFPLSVMPSSPSFTTLQPLTPHPAPPPTTSGISEVILSQQATSWDDGFFLKFPRIIHNAVLTDNGSFGLLLPSMGYNYNPQFSHPENGGIVILHQSGCKDKWSKSLEVLYQCLAFSKYSIPSSCKYKPDTFNSEDREFVTWTRVKCRFRFWSGHVPVTEETDFLVVQ